MTTLYRLFDAKDQLLYIGIADQWTRRATTHAKEKAWWAEVTKTTVEHFPTREVATAAEAKAIRTEHPVHNVMYNGKVPTPKQRRPEEPLDPSDGFVGRYCHVYKDGLPNRQGQIRSEPGIGLFEVLWFSCLHGGATHSTLHRSEDMLEWRFYDNDEDWRHAMDSANEHYYRNLDREAGLTR